MGSVGFEAGSVWKDFVKENATPELKKIINEVDFRIEVVKQASFFNLWNEWALTPIGQLLGLEGRVKVQLKDITGQKLHDVTVMHLSKNSNVY